MQASYPAQELIEMRTMKDREFKRSPHSPLTPEQQHTFDGLAYYQPNPELALTLTPTPAAKKEPVRMLTSQNEVRSYIRWGTIRFEVEGEEAVLTLFATPGRSGFFLPFMDATSGTETYGAGRYVEVELAPDGRIVVDFNQAYNPYCAYNENWSCPLVPPENRLTVPIRAGEKMPTGPWALETH